MPVFDTRSYFSDDTTLGKSIYARFTVEPSGRYKAEFHWAEYGRETRIRLTGQGTAMVDDITMAFHVQKMDRLDGVMNFLCPEFPAHYWETIKRLVPSRKVDA